MTLTRPSTQAVELRNKKDLINQFIASLDIHSVVDEDWQKYVEKKKIEELEEIIKLENLDHDETHKFVRNAFRNGSVATTGTGLAKVWPPVSRFSPGGERSKKRESVLDKLMRFFARFFDISGGGVVAKTDNKALHRTAIPLRSIAAGEIGRSTISIPMEVI